MGRLPWLHGKFHISIPIDLIIKVWEWIWDRGDKDGNERFRNKRVY